METFFYFVLGIYFLLGLYDLKTSNVPDYAPYSLIIFALIYHFLFGYFLNSLIIGTLFFIIGFLLYKIGAWGDGDFWLFACLGFLFPEPFYKTLIPYPLSFILHIFLIGSLYSIFYSLILSLFSKRVRKFFVEEIKKNKKEILISEVILVSIIYLNVYFSFILLFPFLIALLKATEKSLIKKVKVSSLKGDEVLLESREIKEIDKKLLKELKKKKKYVYVKEGIRYVPVFFLTLLFLKIFGSFLFLIFSF